MLKRILVIGTYPITDPQHGGQKRAAAIVDAYKSTFTNVQYVAVFFRGFYSDYSTTDIAISKETEKKATNSLFMSDVVCGEAIFDDPTVKKKMTKLLQSFRPEIIHVEQPFPYLGLSKLLEELECSPKIIFGSQNIEAPMKRAILLNAGADIQKTDEAERLIHGLESQLSKDSMLVAACTPSDLEAHRKMGAIKLVLAPNGIEKSVPTDQALTYWENRFASIGVKNKILYVGSAHPPNWIGFFDMVGKGLGYIPDDSKIILAGSICDYFDKEISGTKTLNIEDATFWLRALSAGRLSEDKLSALIELSDVIILPITEGGGSNLKTAEAILADKKVVTTEHALRSFEWFKDFPNVWVANEKSKFQEAIMNAIKTPRIERTQKQKQLAMQVKWEDRLAELTRAVRGL